MYGITLKYKTPMIAAMIGSGIAAFIGGLLKIGTYAGGPPNLFTLPLFINPMTGDMTDLRNAVICIIIGMIITFILTVILYKDDKADEIDMKGHPGPALQPHHAAGRYCVRLCGPAHQSPV